MRPDPTRWNFSEEEEELADSAPGALECLQIARLGAATLADALCRAPAPPRTEHPSAAFYRQVAVLQLGALAVRSALGLIVLVTHGYEAEAHGLKRRLSEAFSRGQVVIADAAGEEARRWLENSGAGTHGRVAQRVGAHEPWSYFSVGSHADSAGLGFIASPPGWNRAFPDEAVISLKPDRFPRHGNGLLYDAAYETTGMVAMLAEVFGIAVEVPVPLSEGLLSARERLDAGVSGAT